MDIRFDGRIKLSSGYFPRNGPFETLGDAIEFLQRVVQQGVLFNIPKKSYVDLALSQLTKKDADQKEIIAEIKRMFLNCTLTLTTLKREKIYDQQVVVFDLDLFKVESLFRKVRVQPYKRLVEEIKPRYWGVKNLLKQRHIDTLRHRIARSKVLLGEILEKLEELKSCP